jgi:hypothetical protein
MRLVAALVCLALGCSEKKEAPPPPAPAAPPPPAASAGSASDPWAKPASPPADVQCNDADIQKHIDDSLTASMAYLAQLEAKTAAWKTDCEVAKKDFLALEPAATKFMDAMMGFKTWGEQLSDKCRARVAELGDKAPLAADIEKRTKPLEAKVTPMLERCKDHPGFADAAAKGLRVMHRKKP